MDDVTRKILEDLGYQIHDTVDEALGLTADESEELDLRWEAHRPNNGPGGVKCSCCGYAQSKAGDRRTTRRLAKAALKDSY